MTTSIQCSCYRTHYGEGQGFFEAKADAERKATECAERNPDAHDLIPEGRIQLMASRIKANLGWAQ